MGQCIEFTFENGDTHDVSMSYTSYWSRIRPLFTDKNYDKYDMCPPDIFQLFPIKGEFATRMWKVCKLAGYVDLQDTRSPVSVMFCKNS